MRGADDIEAVRTSLALDAGAQDEVHRAGRRLAGEIEGWVESFYVRLVGDPLAMRILHDEGRIVRLKRSLAAWFAEIFALPFDHAYQRAREQIGRTHVRIGMPQHLMVTAMHGVRRDVNESISRVWGTDAAGARRASEALEKVLDLELALMLSAYRRRAAEVRQQAERSLVEAHLRRHASVESREAIDAARCYAALARRASSEPERARWATRLEQVLQEIARAVDRPPALEPDRVRVPLRPLCERALSEVSVPSRTWLDLHVEPPGLEATVQPASLEIVLRDLVQEAVNRGAGGTVRVSARRDGAAVCLEITTSAGPVEDATAEGPAVALVGQVARLHGGSVEAFALPGGGAGVRMRLAEASDADRD